MKNGLVTKAKVGLITTVLGLGLLASGCTGVATITGLPTGVSQTQTMPQNVYITDKGKWSPRLGYIWSGKGYEVVHYSKLMSLEDYNMLVQKTEKNNQL